MRRVVPLTSIHSPTSVPVSAPAVSEPNMCSAAAPLAPQSAVDVLSVLK